LERIRQGKRQTEERSGDGGAEAEEGAGRGRRSCVLSVLSPIRFSLGVAACNS